MQKWFLLFLPIVLVGQGCISSPVVEDTSDDAMMEDGEEMMMEDDRNDGEDAMMEDSDAMEEDGSMMEDDADGEEVTFDISGVNFAFDVEEMRVKKGDTVTVNFTSESGFHDWVVDEFDAATAQVKDGEGTTSVTFVADQTGEFEYYCSVGQHRAQGMIGTLIVE